MSNNIDQKQTAKRNGGNFFMAEYAWGIILLIALYALNIIVWVVL